MELLKLLKLLPMLIMVGTLSYAAYTINGLTTPPVSASTPKAEASAAEAMLTEPEAELVGALGLRPARDPFTAIIKVDPVAKASEKKAAVDPIPGILQNLNLGATLIQGKAQYAVIDGRFYRVGQHLDGPGAASSLVLAKVAFHDVTLTSGGKTYTLGYPDKLSPSSRPSRPRNATPANGDAAILAQDPDLTLMRMLMRSPLGGMGRSMLGMPSPSLPVASPDDSTPQPPDSP